MASKKPYERKTPSKQRKGGPPVVDHPDKPEMKAVNPRRIGRRIVTMATEPEPSKPKGRIMDPVPKNRPAKPAAGAGSGPDRPGDQVPVDAGGEAEAAGGEGYVALRIKAVDGELELRAARFVEGPLRIDEAVTPGLTYEALIGRRRVGYGDVPESSEWRSFPDPEGSGERRGHHVTPRDSFHFTVRIPASEVDEQALESLRVNLYRWRGKGPGEHVAMSDLASEPKAALETMATLRGVSIDALQGGLQRDVRRVIEQAGS